MAEDEGRGEWWDRLDDENKTLDPTEGEPEAIQIYDEAAIAELIERANQGDAAARSELTFVFSTSQNPEQAAVNFGTEDPTVISQLQTQIQMGIAKLGGESSYTPYWQAAEADIINPSGQGSGAIAGGITPPDFSDMTAEERNVKFREDLGFILSGGDPSGFGGDFSAISELQGFVDPETGKFQPGYEQTDLRLGDTRNTRGMLPGQAHDYQMTQISSAGDRLGRMLEDMAPREARALMLSLDSNELARWQRAMDDAGLYGDAPPVFGMLSSDDFAAFDQLKGFSNLAAGKKSMTTILQDLTDANMGSIATRTGVLDQANVSNRVVTLTSSDALRQMAEEIGVSDMGRRPPKATVDRAIAAVHGRERQYHTERTEGEDINAGLRNPDRERFIEAMGGVAQFSAPSWQHWSNMTFGGPVEQSAANKDAVAHSMVEHYFQRYGDWGAVAEALWNGPEKGMWGNTFMNDQLGNTTGPEFSAGVMRSVAQSRADAAASLDGESGGLSFVEAPDATAIMNRELRAADEVGYQTWQFADAASNFYRLLGSTY